MHCICCGTCCSKFQPRLSLEEAKLLAQKLEVEWDRFLNEYTDRRWPGTASFLLRQVDGACIFLKRSSDSKQGLCRIHEFKPECCRDWQSGIEKPECREGLQKFWKLTADSSGKICGSRTDLEEFERYLGS